MIKNKVPKAFLIWFAIFHIVFLYVVITYGDMIFGITQNSDYQQWQSFIEGRTENDDKIIDIVLAFQSISVIINSIFAVLLCKMFMRQGSIRKLVIVVVACMITNWMVGTAINKFMMWEYLPTLLLPGLITTWSVVIFIKLNK